MNLKLDNCKFYLCEEWTDPHGGLLEVVVNLNIWMVALTTPWVLKEIS